MRRILLVLGCLLIISLIPISTIRPMHSLPRKWRESMANTSVIIADFNTLYQGSVNRDSSQLYYFNYSRLANETDAFRVSVSSGNAKSQYPVFVIVKQQKGVLSWQLPLVLERQYPFVTTCRILCPTINYKNQDASETAVGIDSDIVVYQDLYLDLSSSSPLSVDYSLSVQPIVNFFIETNVPLMLNVTPSEPQYVEYVLPQGVDRVLVQMVSHEPEKYCGYFSVQPAICPVADIESELILGGLYQSVTSRGSIVVTRSDLPKFYIVLTVRPVDIFCRDMERILIPDGGILPHQRKKIVELLVMETLSTTGYIIAISACAAFFGSFYLVTCILIAGHSVRSSYSIASNSAQETDQPDVDSDKILERDVEEDTIPESSPSQQASSEKCTVSANSMASQNSDFLDSAVRRRASDSSLEEEVDFLNDAEEDKNIIRTKTEVRVEDMTKKTRKRLGKKDRQYRWSMITICIFYGLPVLQLVITYQRVLRNTGNEDICFYNFSCANPLGILSDFNHVISNIGYVMLGVLFIILVRRRQLQVAKQLGRDPFQDEVPKGIPAQFELFYAIGLALMMEGLMSASYHICPSYSNFQFDTSFMYLIGGLGMLKTYQARHADILPNAYTSYAFFAFIILIAVLGVVYVSIYVWIAFSAALILVSMVLGADIYFLGIWQLNLGVFRRVYLKVRMDGFWSWPLHMDRFILLLFIIGVNWTIAIIGPLWQPLDFASYLLAAIVANFVLYVLFYMLMKLRSKERIGRQTIFFILCSALSWSVSLYLFAQNRVNWQLTPSRSREVNDKCIFLSFYDEHDLWHILSACSIFFSFMILLTLDDDLATVARTEIAVF